MKMARKINPEYKPMLCVMVKWLMMKKYTCSICGMVEECDADPACARSWAWIMFRLNHGSISG